jgi:nucleoside-diphosphate-sugar epimerase
VTVPILITGHSGFIGTALGSELERSGIAWRGVSRRTGFDLEQHETLDALPEASCIIHLAGRSEVGPSWRDPAGYHKSNHSMTLNVLDRARSSGARVIYISSYMYGVPLRLPIDEAHPAMCVNPYAWSKRIGEVLCEAYARDFGLDVLVLRPFNLFGSLQPTSQIVPYIVHQALDGPTIEVNDLNPKRDFLWIEDMARAIVAALDSGHKGFDVINIGSGMSLSVAQIIEEVTSQLGSREVFCRGQSRPNDIPDCICDASKAARLLGWKPETSFRQGIARMICDIRQMKSEEP